MTTTTSGLCSTGLFFPEITPGEAGSPTGLPLPQKNFWELLVPSVLQAMPDVISVSQTKGSTH